MTSLVFNDELEQFCSKYLVTGKKLNRDDARQFPKLFISQQASIFEQLLLFDQVAFKVHGENVPLALLITDFGIKGVEQLIEQDALNFVLWTPQILHFVDAIPGIDPIAAGNLSSKAHSDPEESITLGFDWLINKPSRAQRRSLVRKLRDKYKLPDPSLAQTAADTAKSSYKSGKLDGYGFNSQVNDLRSLDLAGRKRLSHCAEDLLMYKFLLSNDMTSLSKPIFYDFLSDSLTKFRHPDSTIECFQQIANLEKFPNLQELFTKIDRPFERIASIRNKRSSRQFRSWLEKCEQRDCVHDITKEYVDAIVNSKGFFDTATGKFTKTITMKSVGAGLGAIAGGMPGSLVGVGIASVAEPVVDIGLDLVDQFLLNGLLKGWTPRMFIDSLRLEAEHKQQ